MRLVDGGSRCAGRVEIKHQEEWRRLDTWSFWSMRDAAVVCRELDCGSAVSTRRYDGDEDRRVWWFDSRCAGTESALRECGGVMDRGRNTSYVIEVICSGNTHNVVTFTWGSW